MEINQPIRKLPADPGAMALGIIALVISVVGCCCGILAIPAMILSIIGLVWAIKSQSKYRNEPGKYAASSYSSVNTAKIVNIIALIMSVLFLIISIAILGSFMMNPEELMENFENGTFNQNADDVNYENGTDPASTTEIDEWKYEEDSINNNIDIESNDTLAIDRDTIK